MTCQNFQLSKQPVTFVRLSLSVFNWGRPTIARLKMHFQTIPHDSAPLNHVHIPQLLEYSLHRKCRLLVIQLCQWRADIMLQLLVCSHFCDACQLFSVCFGLFMPQWTSASLPQQQLIFVYVGYLELKHKDMPPHVGLINILCLKILRSNIFSLFPKWLMYFLHKAQLCHQKQKESVN